MGKAKMKQKEEQVVDLRADAKRLIEEINDKWYDFSTLAVKIDEEKLWQEWGYETVKDYVEQELKIEYRTWRYRVAMGKALERYGLTKAHVQDLGWAKFKELASLFIGQEYTLDEVHETLAKVRDEGMTAREVAEFARSARRTYGADVEPAMVKVKLTFSMMEEAAAVVEGALEVAMQLLNTESQAAALEYICTEWMASRK